MPLRHLSPAIVALLLLAAHFYRAGAYLLMLICLVLVAAVLVRRAWVALVMQVALGLGALEWLMTAVLLAAERRQSGAPYVRMGLILGAVALFTVFAAVLLRHPRVRDYFGAADAAEVADRSAPPPV
ncbi:MAG: hypothetical protein ACR2I0_06625 [Rhodoferax sp.]